MISQICPYCSNKLIEQEEKGYEFLSCDHCDLFFDLDGKEIPKKKEAD